MENNFNSGSNEWFDEKYCLNSNSSKKNEDDIDDKDDDYIPDVTFNKIGVDYYAYPRIERKRKCRIKKDFIRDKHTDEEKYQQNNINKIVRKPKKKKKKKNKKEIETDNFRFYNYISNPIQFIREKTLPKLPFTSKIEGTKIYFENSNKRKRITADIIENNKRRRLNESNKMDVAFIQKDKYIEHLRTNNKDDIKPYISHETIKNGLKQKKFYYNKKFPYKIIHIPFSTSEMNILIKALVNYGDFRKKSSNIYWEKYVNIIKDRDVVSIENFYNDLLNIGHHKLIKLNLHRNIETQSINNYYQYYQKKKYCSNINDPVPATYYFNFHIEKILYSIIEVIYHQEKKQLIACGGSRVDRQHSVGDDPIFLVSYEIREKNFDSYITGNMPNKMMDFTEPVSDIKFVNDNLVSISHDKKCIIWDYNSNERKYHKFQTSLLIPQDNLIKEVLLSTYPVKDRLLWISNHPTLTNGCFISNGNGYIFKVNWEDTLDSCVSTEFEVIKKKSIDEIQFSKLQLNTIYGLSQAPDNKKSKGLVFGYDLNSKKIVKKFNFDDKVNQYDVSDNYLAISGLSASVVSIFNINNTEKNNKIFKLKYGNCKSPIDKVKFHPTNENLIYFTFTNKLFIYDLRNVYEPYLMISDENQEIFCSNWAEKSNLIAYGNSNINIFDYKKNVKIQSYQPPDHNNKECFSLVKFFDNDNSIVGGTDSHLNVISRDQSMKHKFIRL